jgi:hypothetical protein
MNFHQALSANDMMMTMPDSTTPIATLAATKSTSSIMLPAPLWPSFERLHEHADFPQIATLTDAEPDVNVAAHYPAVTDHCTNETAQPNHDCQPKQPIT